MDYAPLFFKLGTHTRFTIIGGGNIALSKTETLTGLGAKVHVAAREILPELKTLLEQTDGSYVEAEYAASQISSATIVIAATDDRALNERIYRDAKDQRKIVNVVDTPELSDFIFPATIKRGDV